MKLLKTFLVITALVAVFLAFFLYEFHRFSFSSLCYSFSFIRKLVPYLCSGGSSRIAMIVLFIVPASLIIFFAGLSLRLNKKRMIIFMSVVFVCFSVIVVLPKIFDYREEIRKTLYDRERENVIRSELEKARYCTVDSDCVITTAPCPYDCSNPINKKEVERIQQLPGGSSCMRSMNSPGHPSNGCRADARGVACINNTCTIDWPQLFPEDLII